MPKLVKDELGGIHVVSSPEKEERKEGDKKSFYAVRVQFITGSYADIAYYEEREDAVARCRTITRELANVLGITKFGVVELEVITKSS